MSGAEARCSSRAKSLMRFSATESLLLLALLAVSPAGLAWKMEAGVVRLNSTLNGGSPTSVTLQQAYDVTPLVFALPSEQGGHPSDIRIRSVTTSGFVAMQAEPNGHDGGHAAMDMHYIAIEPGDHTLPNGSLIQAGSVNTTQHQRGYGGVFPLEGWENLVFPQAFSGTAAVIAQIQTMANETGGAPNSPSEPWLTTAIQSVTAIGFSTALDRTEANEGSITNNETIGWLAMEDDAFDTFVDNGNQSVNVAAVISSGRLGGWDNSNGGVNFRTTVSYPSLGGGSQPVIAASLNERRDDDGGWVRYRQNTPSSTSVQLRGDEDADRDTERKKNGNETNYVGVIAFSNPFNASFEPDLLFMKRVDRVVSDPLNGTSNAKAIPEAVVQYVLNVTNHGNGVASNVVISDPIPANATMYVGDINGANSGPVRVVSGTSGLGYSYTPGTPTLDNLEFSQDGGSTWDYQPTPGSTTPDPLVTHFRVNFTGNFSANPSGTAPSFDLYFRVVVD